MATSNEATAAAAIVEELFATDRTAGYVGSSPGKLFIYVHAKKSKWRNPMPSEYRGLKVEWHFGVGRSRAVALPLPA